MSDEEYEYDYGSDAEYDYGSDNGEGNESGSANDELIEIENSFYEGEDIKQDQPLKAIELFEKVVRMETNKGGDVKWRFKALQNLVTVNYSLGRNSEMVDKYRDMLEYMSSVTRNECTEAINVILDALTTATDVDILTQMYEITLLALKSANNERMWFNTNLKLARVHLSAAKYGEVEKIIELLKQSCRLSDGGDDNSKGASLLEIYCLEIQLCTLTHNSHRMRQIYPKTMNLNAAVADPRIMGIIREEGGKMHMSEGNWEEAYNELYEAFRNYQQAGNNRARDCLKYVVLASMLALSGINPFAAREAKVFADDKEIIAMSELRASLEANDLSKFERILNLKQNRIVDEPFLMKYIQPLRRRMREQVLVNFTKPFSKVTISYLAEELSLDVADTESLLVDMIKEERLSASIDQVNQIVLVFPTTTTETVQQTQDRLDEKLAIWARKLQDKDRDMGTRVYVGNLPIDIREREIDDLFYKYGRIRHIDIKTPSRPPAFAFVVFEDPRDAEDAIYGRDGYMFDNFRLRVEMAKGERRDGGRDRDDRGGRFDDRARGRGGGRRTDFGVVVTNLPKSCSWQDLKDFMRKAGDVVYTDVDNRGEGIVEYSNKDDMENAVEKLDDTEFKNSFGATLIRVKYANGDSSSGKRADSRDRGRGDEKARGRSPSKSRSRSRDRGGAGHRSSSRDRDYSDRDDDRKRGASPARDD